MNGCGPGVPGGTPAGVNGCAVGIAGVAGTEGVCPIGVTGTEWATPTAGVMGTDCSMMLGPKPGVLGTAPETDPTAGVAGTEFQKPSPPGVAGVDFKTLLAPRTGVAGTECATLTGVIGAMLGVPGVRSTPGVMGTDSKMT